MPAAANAVCSRHTASGSRSFRRWIMTVHAGKLTNRVQKKLASSARESARCVPAETPSGELRRSDRERNRMLLVSCSGADVAHLEPRVPLLAARIQVLLLVRRGRRTLGTCARFGRHEAMKRARAGWHRAESRGARGVQPTGAAVRHVPAARTPRRRRRRNNSSRRRGSASLRRRRQRAAPAARLRLRAPVAPPPRDSLAVSYDSAPRHQRWPGPSRG